MSDRTIVLKFETSVLESVADLPLAVDEIYRHVREGARVLAVVPALGDFTQALRRDSQRISGRPAPAGLARLLATGEQRTAALLELSLTAAGVPTCTLDPSEIQFNTVGALFEPSSVSLDVEGVQRAFRDHAVVVLPGLVSVDRASRGLALIRVGDDSAQHLRSVDPAPDFLRVGLLGHGAVGRAVLERLDARPGVRCTGVAARDLEAHVAAGVDRERLTADPLEVVHGHADVIVEATGSDAAHTWIEAALESGKHVITAHKRLLAEHGPRLEELAERHDRWLLYSAAVGGAVPILETVVRLRPRGIGRVDAVLNGTCNFVLDRLVSGESLDAAVSAARFAGFAESDPTRDISGQDSADKLRIIARRGFGAELDSMDVTGIEEAEPGQRLLASVWRCEDRVVARVAPAVCDDPFLAATAGADNRVRIQLDDGHVVRLSGAGAGGPPTALSLLADLGTVERRRSAMVEQE